MKRPRICDLNKQFRLKKQFCPTHSFKLQAPRSVWPAGSPISYG